MAKLSVSVMAHSSRAHLIPELVQRLGIGVDRVTWDRIANRWDTGRRAWEAYDPDATHHMVLQDDAVVTRDLIPALEEALDHIPRNAIASPYIGTRRPQPQKVIRAITAAREAQASWIVMGSLNWGVGIIIPTHAIEDMLPWCDQQPYPNYDKRIGQYFLKVKRWPTWCTWPSLVDHRDDEESLCGHGPGRYAHEFLGQDHSALDVDFGRGHVVMNTAPPATPPAERRRRRREAAAERRQARLRERKERRQVRIRSRRIERKKRRQDGLLAPEPESGDFFS